MASGERTVVFCNDRDEEVARPLCALLLFENVTDVAVGRGVFLYEDFFACLRRESGTVRLWRLPSGPRHDGEVSLVDSMIWSRAKLHARVLVLVDSLAPVQAAALFSRIEDVADALRHVQWTFLRVLAQSAKQSQMWAENFPRLSCDSRFAAWSTLAAFDVAAEPYAASCERRISLTATEYASPKWRRLYEQTPLWNAISQTLLEAMRFFGVRMRRVVTSRRNSVGLMDSRGLFTGTLGELQRRKLHLVSCREFDVHLSDMALELQRFHSFLFMETAYVTSLDFVYAVPVAVVGPGPTQLAAILPLRLWLCATAAALGAAVMITILRIAAESVCLAWRLVALCFGQPLGWRDDLLLSSHQDTLELPPLGLDSLKYGHRQRLLAACSTKRKRRMTHSGRCAARLLLSLWLLSVVALLTAVKSCLISRLRTPPAPSALDSTERLREALAQGLVRPCLVSKTSSAEYVLQSHVEEQRRWFNSDPPVRGHRNHDFHLMVHYRAAMKKGLATRFFIV
ncbi:hypothetical protein MTO96_010099 [Rhipicephalus appendiculatus]